MLAHDPYSATPTNRISTRRTDQSRPQLKTTGTTGCRRSSPAFSGPTSPQRPGPLACDRPPGSARTPAFTPSGAIPMTAAPTRPVDTSERSTALPRRAATFGALLAAALGGTAGRASAADESTTKTSTATHPASPRARPSCSRRQTGTWSAASPTASRPELARTYAGRVAPSEWFERQLKPEGDQGPPGRADRSVVAQPAPQPRGPLAAPDRRRRGRLGGHGRLRPLGDDAPDDLEAAAARGHGGVLREPPARRGGAGTRSSCTGSTTATPSASTRWAASTRCCARPRPTRRC